MLEEAATRAAAAKGADRNSRNVAVLGFACGVDSLKSRFAPSFKAQLEWSTGRPNISTVGEPSGVVADPLSFTGIIVGVDGILNEVERHQIANWSRSVWTDSNVLFSDGGWRRGLLETLGFRLTILDVVGNNSNHPEWLTAALIRRGWSLPFEKSATEVLDRALEESTRVADAFEAGLRVAAIEWAVSRYERPITLVLSGGGLRATLFQLGVVAYLVHMNDLGRVGGLVSVSGGSILAAHLASRWRDAIESLQSFVTVAADLVRFARSDIRHNIVVPWIWSRLNPLAWFRESASLSGRLRSAFNVHFSKTRLGDLNQPGFPQVAFVATDAVRLERIAFTAGKVARFPVSPDAIESGHTTHIVADSTGVPLSLAVATSACFPPVFPRMKLTHRDFGLRYDEFKDELSLNDGGVIGNLGIEVLLSLRDAGWSLADEVLVVDAERPQGKKPGTGPATDVGAQGAALSRAAVDLAKQRLGADLRIISFSKRQPTPPELAFTTQTPLASFRTDLDAPNWRECQALMLHGFAAATVALGKPVEHTETAKAGEKIVSSILEGAGAPQLHGTPTDIDLEKSQQRPMARVIIHGLLVLCIAIVVCFLVYRIYVKTLW
ncbi:patatin-like phospholipase family protein [Verrucomicrobium sp. BvORR106]|uniref:patatin-like phospholipase family protein n=1 Tax=Verrucomicrobium sp. BvORR106 TaxID=1403819 RepID=UPI002240EEE1|nr:patatin-like phospholipase family protein [Verrucomicrobium sp. BvORR106]